MRIYFCTWRCQFDNTMSKTLQTSAPWKLARATKLPCLTPALKSHLFTSASKSQITKNLFIGTKKKNTVLKHTFARVSTNFFSYFSMIS